MYKEEAPHCTEWCPGTTLPKGKILIIIVYFGSLHTYQWVSLTWFKVSSQKSNQGML